MIRGGVDILRRALVGLSYRPRTVLFSVAAISVAVLLFGMVRLLGANVHDATSQWRSGVDMVVYLEDETSRHRAQQIQDALEQLPAVDGTDYVGTDAALARLRESLGEHDELASTVSATMLPTSIEVSFVDGVRDVAEAHPVIGRLEGVRGVEEVEFLGEWVDRMSSLSAALGYAAWFITVLVGFCVAFIASMTLRLSISRRRQEVATLELLGATRGYARAPMVLEGAIQGALGGAVAVALLWALYRFTSVAVSEALGNSLGAVDIHFLSLAELGLIVAMGATFGLGGSFMATGQRALARA